MKNINTRSNLNWQNEKPKGSDNRFNKNSSTSAIRIKHDFLSFSPPQK